jgi:hypothetical protein
MGFGFATAEDFITAPFKATKEPVMSDIKFIHYRPTHMQSGACIGYKVDLEYAQVVIAIHPMPHQYNKKVGRMVCAGRIAKGRTIEIPYLTATHDEVLMKCVLLEAMTFLGARSIHV